MKSLSDIIPWIIIIVGAVINFAAKPILQKNSDDGNKDVSKKIAVVKIIGLWLVIIGAMWIFIAGGSFGVRK